VDCSSLHEKKKEEGEYQRLIDSAGLEDEPLEISPKSEVVQNAEQNFKALQICTAIFMAFSHGGNDVANAVGPYAAILEYRLYGKVTDAPIPWYVIVVGGVGIVLGLSTLGYKVIKTIGEKITELTFSRGYSAELGAATTVILATYLSLPISTTTTLVGSVTATGFVKSTTDSPIRPVDKKLLLKILASWIFTLLIGISLTAALYAIMRAIFK